MRIFMFEDQIGGGVFSFLVGLGFKLKTSNLEKQVLYCLSHTSSPFCSGYFGDGVL
jgi:hypothetical protein